MSMDKICRHKELVIQGNAVNRVLNSNVGPAPTENAGDCGNQRYGDKSDQLLPPADRRRADH